jgi:C4-dicarboxylate-specific signal transduction histidine kinase
MGRLCASITHEINNHLTPVSGYAQLLLSQDKAKTVTKEVDKIYTSATKCQKLIAELRRFARFSDSREYDNINLILKSSLDLVRRLFEKQSIQLLENYAADIPALEVDTPALQQMFLNVIQNSFEALQEKGSGLSVATFKENGHIVALFEDDGPGLSEDARASLFTPFFTTKAHLRCVGLGLLATKMLAEAHGGTLEIGDHPKGGTRVKISFPCQSD